MKKKIAIVSKVLNIGGVEKALISMLNSINLCDYEIDLYLPQLNGCLMNEIPSSINIIRMSPLIEGSFLNKLVSLIINPIQGVKLFFYLLTVKLNSKVDFCKQQEIAVYYFKKNKIRYDIAISYDGTKGFSTFYTLYNLKSNEKYIWIHGNVIQDEVPKFIVNNYYSKYNKLIFVSESIKHEFLCKYPSFKSSSLVFYNFLEKEKIINMANQVVQFPDSEKTIKILTIGRLSYEKGFFIALDACERLLDKGYRIKWYICGDGLLRDDINIKIREKKLYNYFILLGNKLNPYPYLSQCDIYVQPSLTEGFCTTTNEARIFAKPIVVTDVGGMKEQFIDHKTAIITEINCDSLCSAIEEIINNPILRKTLIDNLKSIDVNCGNSLPF